MKRPDVAPCKVLRHLFSFKTKLCVFETRYEYRITEHLKCRSSCIKGNSSLNIWNGTDEKRKYENAVINNFASNGF